MTIEAYEQTRLRADEAVIAAERQEQEHAADVASLETLAGQAQLLRRQLHHVQDQMDSIERSLMDYTHIAPNPPALVTGPRPGSRAAYYGLQQAEDFRGLTPMSLEANNPDYDMYTHGTTFSDAAQARAYADAIETLVLLRRQPGTVPAVNMNQPTIMVDTRHMVPSVVVRQGVGTKLSYVCPTFDSARSARRAIHTVGGRRIMRMMDTLQGRTDGRAR